MYRHRGNIETNAQPANRSRINEARRIARAMRVRMNLGQDVTFDQYGVDDVITRQLVLQELGDVHVVEEAPF